MKKMIVGLMAVALLATSGVALAQGWGRGTGYGPGPAPGYGPGPGPAGAWGANLNLTAEQQQRMQALRQSHFNEMAPLWEKMINKQAELRTLWAQPEPNLSQIREKQMELNALREQMQEKQNLHRLEMRNILTPEQKAQLGAAIGQGYGPGYGKRGGFGPGRGMGIAGCPRW